MYNDLTRELLRQVKFEDGIILAEQTKYSVSDSFSTVEIYICDKRVSYRVYGDAYILAMLKWLQLSLLNKQNLSQISLEKLIADFDLPQVKYRDALQIIKLIEKINAAAI
ncbi:hypothetical protein [Francisella tularensis]|uniref:Uncharacterized protein n=2 Tax=Francisella tularensis TaxID=263 RepID=A0A6I4RU54_FRATU|nr:hypothetical protein [Francisella tularensis]ACD30696.1 conserved hypothetical protein [Francisella tularensis subsp. mediasiatica FSC147]AHH46208.1 hypothetical protein X557_03855 [Francisella tularensis subsp. holarctica PHIT-FT049]ABK90125.1 hypothetical protein FTN_1244 [Francisella tularensis subsp. novicida U112]AJI45979.1 hypothetical protein AS84_1270 [Francisella tularensis subsp. novicida F6168]AJI61780.1 hypothetical protein AW25_762 [Francisella tularensis subsp. novicida U112]